jgi:hypothetical protein
LKPKTVLLSRPLTTRNRKALAAEEQPSDWRFGRGGVELFLFLNFSETIQIRAQNRELIRGTIFFVLEMEELILRNKTMWRE